MSKIVVLLILAVAVPASGQWQEKPDGAGFFAAAAVTGTIAVLDLRDSAGWNGPKDRCFLRSISTCPTASTMRPSARRSPARYCSASVR